MNKRLFIIAQIIFFLGILFFMLYREFKPPAPLDYNPKSWRSREGFLAISFSDISNKGKEHISRKTLLEQLSRLQKAGYKTITPEDIVNFYEKKTPLPKKALFIMFEEDRKESYLYARKMLKDLGMLATMCVPTSLMRKRGGVFLKEKELIKLVKDPHWSLGSMGDLAIKGIPVDSKGTLDHFLSHRMWKKGKLEDLFSFKYRIFEDYKKSAEILNRIYKPTGRKVLLYLYPYSDAGTALGAYTEAEKINREALEKFYKIAFISSNNPLNTPKSDPYSLTRLRIPSNWDAERLVNELERFSPKSQFYQIVGDKKDWIEKGKVKTAGFLLTPNSNIWLRGSDNWSNIKGDVKIILIKDASFVIFLRYTSNKSFFSISINKIGVYVREKIGKSYQTLVRYPLKDKKENFHDIKFILKGKRAWVWHDNNLISKPIPISSNTVKGRIGFLAQNADVKFLDFRASEIPKTYVFVNSYKDLNQDAQKIVTGIIPIWYSEKQSNDFLKELEKNKNKYIYEIYIGTYNNKIEAEAIKEFVKSFYFNPKIRAYKIDKGETLYEVTIGPYFLEKDTTKDIEFLKNKGFNPFIRTITLERRMENEKEGNNINGIKKIEEQKTIISCKYYISIGIFRELKNAEGLYEQFKKEFENTLLVQNGYKKIYHQVLIGYFDSLEETKQKLKTLKNKLKKLQLKYFIGKKCSRKNVVKSKEQVSYLKDYKDSSYVIKVKEYKILAEAEALYEFLRKKGFVCFEREIVYDNPSKPVYGVFVGPFSTQEELIKTKKALKELGIDGVILPLSVDEEKETDILKAASIGIKTIPLIKIKTKLDKKSAENLVKAILSELRFPAIKLLLKYFAIYGKESELHKAFHKYGFNILRIVTPKEALDIAKKKWALGDDMILIYGNEKEVRRVYNIIVRNIPEDKILIQTIGKTEGIKGLKIAIKGMK